MRNVISQSSPLARISVDKNELRVYELGKIYLNHGTEFQIMLFNPTQGDILAKVYLNDKSIGTGLILRPGQRVWLERYFDENRKFLFETYDVEDSSAAKTAIEKNGLVKVEFYREQPVNQNWSFDSIDYAPDELYRRRGTTGAPTYNDFTTTSGNMSVNCSYSTGVEISADQHRQLLFDSKLSRVKQKKEKSIETGKIAKGSTSEQEFGVSDQKFEFLPFATESFQLLPISQKIYLSTEDLKIRYCVNCGKKARSEKSKFCSKCGTKL